MQEKVIGVKATGDLAKAVMAPWDKFVEKRKEIVRNTIYSLYCTSVLASNGVFSKASDTQFIIIVDNDTMVYITYPKFNDAVVHQIPERYYGIHNVPKILLWYIITKYHHMIPRYLKENQTPLITSWQFFIYLFFLFSFAC